MILDIKVFPDMTFNLLDEDEYERHRSEMNYPDAIDQILKRNVEKLDSLDSPTKRSICTRFY